MDTQLDLSGKVLHVEKMMRESKYLFFRLLPRFVMKKLKSFIREDQINALHQKTKEKQGIEYVYALLEELNIQVYIHHAERVENADRCIFVANHPLGGVDALSFLKSIHQLKGEVVSPSNNFFSYVPNLRPLIVGVNVFGRNTRQQTDAINQVFLSDKQIMIFPAGLVSRKINGKMQDTPWQKSFVSKAIQTQRFVVPVFISGQNSPVFNLIYKIRKMMGIGIPLEAARLPAELFLKKGSDIHLIFGDPLPPDFFDRTKTPLEWAKYVREMVYKLDQEHVLQTPETASAQRSVVSIQ
jgi:putative hemolysin